MGAGGSFAFELIEGGGDPGGRGPGGDLGGGSGGPDPTAPDAGAAEPHSQPTDALRGRAGQLAVMPRLQMLRALETSARGLTESEADARASAYGENILSMPATPGGRRRLTDSASNPFVILLLVLAGIAAFTGNPFGAVVVTVGAVVSCGLRVHQESRGERAAAALRAMVCATATVTRRSGPLAQPVARESPVAGLVPGDVVLLAPGDLVPADLYLLSAADLAISEWVLTGESRPAAKIAAPVSGPTPSGLTPSGPTASAHDPLDPCPSPDRPDSSWLCLMGGTVAHGSGTGVVIATGAATAFGAAHAAAPARPSGGAFDRSVRRVTWLLLGFMGVAVPAVLALAARAHGLPAPVLAFALAVAVGLTPEMLPVVITTVLARAARALAGDGTVVRRLPAVHELAAMDTLCIDKTGTLTEGRLVVTGSVDVEGASSPTALYWAAAISDAVVSRAPGLTDAFDEALTAAGSIDEPDLQVLDVLPFDPTRRRVSALLRDPGRLGSVILATRGAVAEVLDACGATPAAPLTAELRAHLLEYADEQARHGARLLAVAVADLPPRRAHAPLRPDDERSLTLVGFVALRDQAKPSAPEAIAGLADLGVRVAVLTGDTPEVAVLVCRDIGLDPGRVVTGDQVDACDDTALILLARGTSVFARVGPGHKARVVAALQAGGRVVGFLGDGVNDAPALRTADVGIAVRGGAELARECADVVLGDKDLACLARAITASRLAVANAISYLRITVSSNLGNALSIALAVLVLPFLPMLPLQVLVQNLCFDMCQLALALDRADPSALRRPRHLSARDPALFALAFGPLNTLADLATFVALHHFLLDAPGASMSPAVRAAFHAGWFAENLLTQALAMLLLRSRRPARSARPARAVAAAGFLLALIGLALPLTRPGATLSFAAPPVSFYPVLALIAAGYCTAVIAVKAGSRVLRPRW